MIGIKNIILLFLLFPIHLFAQTLVPTAVLPRNAILEQFTGVNCQFCPDGDQRAVNLINDYPGRVTVINIHSGIFADPNPGQPDYRTPFGDAIDSMAAGIAYPYGTMNRMLFPGTVNQPPYFPQNPPDNLAIRRPGWWDFAYPHQGAGALVVLQGGNSPVNIGAATIWNSITRELDITVELYYTASEFQPNKLNVAFVENGLIGDQVGWGPNYVHNFVLRDLITGQWGESVTTTSAGTFVSRNYLYTVPAGYNIDSCAISIFVTQNDNKNTHTTITIPAKNGTTVGLYENPELFFQLYPNPADEFIVISGPDLLHALVKIFNATGQLVYSAFADEIPRRLDISYLPEGFYLVEVDSGSKKIIRKLVK
jgi:hypothetical protein